MPNILQIEVQIICSTENVDRKSTSTQNIDQKLTPER
jgi:hypothetical protein